MFLHNFENLMVIFFPGVHAKCAVSIRWNNAMNNTDQGSGEITAAVWINMHQV